MDMDVISPFELRQFPFSQLTQINTDKGIDGHAEICGKLDQGRDTGLGHFILIPAQGRALHPQGKCYIILGFPLAFPQQADIG
jgi:hypothetical protein